MEKYNFPHLKKEQVIYKGKRYIAFLIDSSILSSHGSEHVDFVVWDGLYDAEVSSGTMDKAGNCLGCLSFSHVEIAVKKSESIRDFVKKTALAQGRYFKDCGT